jgi:N-formylglutamate deformylase
MNSQIERAMAGRLPSWVILHVPHDATRIPYQVRDQFVLSDELLAREVLRMTDSHTRALFCEPHAETSAVVAPVSRLVVDVERFEDDAAEPMAEIGMGVVYRRGSSLQALRRALTRDEHERLLADYYRPHHVALNHAAAACLAAHGRVLLLDCHSFPSRPLPYEPAQRADRPDICIGTDDFHTPPALAEAFIDTYAGAGFTVRRDSPFAGAMMAAPFHRSEPRACALMVEVNRGLYMDEASGAKLDSFDRFAATLQRLNRQAVARWIEATPA